MFDKLIESNSAAAEFKPRRKFFMVSSVVVGIVFLSAVVVSLYAQDLNLGTDNFELSTIVAPVTPDAPEPERPRQRQQPQQAHDQQREQTAVRTELIARLDQHQKAPTEISTIPNRVPPIPEGASFTFDPNGVNRNGYSAGAGRPTGIETGTSSGGDEIASETVKLPDPPTVIKKTEAPPKAPTTMSKGVVNGTAISLPKPPYSATALAVGAGGDVKVQVLIDEQGNVVSAQAVSGHPTLRRDAERAAERAKFKPTLLSNQPVKVTGIIVYKFAR